jgi:hypothetical protein
MLVSSNPFKHTFYLKNCQRRQSDFDGVSRFKKEVQYNNAEDAAMR